MVSALSTIPLGAAWPQSIQLPPYPLGTLGLAQNGVAFALSTMPLGGPIAWSIQNISQLPITLSGTLGLAQNGVAFTIPLGGLAWSVQSLSQLPITLLIH